MTTLAPYASKPENSQGRIHQEPSPPHPQTPYRSPYQHDRDRIIHSRTFRRIKHKTQVFLTTTLGDHYRTRLTHSLEVAQIARTIARILRLDEDLTETIALAHDIGHPPFGHDGEDALNKKMKDFGGFNHNIQTIRNVTLLEQQYPNFPGLNLTIEAIDGLIKHNGPLKKSLQQSDTIQYLQQFTDLQLDQFSSAEAQVAAIADDVAYNNHDIEDGIRANLITISDLKDIKHLNTTIKSIQQQYPDCPDELCVRELIRRQITQWIQGIIHTTEKNIAGIAANNNTTTDKITHQHIRTHNKTTVDFAPHHKPQIKILRQFLMQNVYTADPERKKSAHTIINSLFDAYSQNPPSPPSPHLPLSPNKTKLDEATKARYICDYIAGMTDGFAIAEFDTLTLPTLPPV